MNKKVGLLFILVITASCITVAKPASSEILAGDSWTLRASMHQARGGLGVVAVNGKIYAIGGSIASGPYPPTTFAGGFVGTNEEYDVATATWVNKAPIPTPRSHFAIATYENKIYCIGGAVNFTVDERSGFYSIITSAVNEVYDIATNTWETKTPMPDEGMTLQAHVVNGKIYVMDWSLTYVYDPVTDSWASKARMPPPYPKSSPVSVLVGNKIIVSGEFAVGLDYVSVQKVMIYDTETDSWTEGAYGPRVVVEGAAGATVGTNAPQRVYVLGLASNQARPTSVNLVYDPATNTWTTAAAMPTNRTDFGVTVVNDTLYVIGGYPHLAYEVSPTSMNDQYTPLGYGTIKPHVFLVSPENRTYDSSNVVLNFTVDRQPSWLGYSLDGQLNETVASNVTIIGLANGSHNITVYAQDLFDNFGASETILFTIAVQPPFPIVPVAAAVVAIVIGGAGLLAYFKKHKYQKV